MTVTHAEFIKELGQAHRAQVRELNFEAQQLGGRRLFSLSEIAEIEELLAKAYTLGRNHEMEMADAKEEATA